MRITAVLLGVALCLAAGCNRTGPVPWQGYLEGEFVYVSSPLGGQLETLSVEKGAQVEKGSPLFTLEDASESDAKRQAQDQVKAAEARAADLTKGSRPSEIAALEARLAQAKATADLSQTDLARQEKLYEGHAIPASDFDKARFTQEANLQAVQDIAAQLATARIGGRSDLIQAADSDVAAAKAAFAKAEWDESQKAQKAPCSGLVYDTLYRPGEYVPPMSPVVALLPPGNLKVRFYVSNDDFAALKAGEEVSVELPGRAALKARVSYLSPQPEFTPPVLYNRDNRSKLVYLVEAVFSGADAKDLHPGQPVDVARPAP